MNTAEEVLYNEEVYERSRAFLIPVFFIIGLAVIAIAFIAFLHFDYYYPAFFILPFGLSFFVISNYYSKRLKRKLEILGLDRSRLCVRVSGRHNSIEVNPAAKIGFYFSDDLMKGSYDRFSASGSGFPLLGSVLLYAVFFDSDANAVFALCERQQRFVLHIPRKGFEEIENSPGQGDFINLIPVFNGSVARIYSFCKIDG